jgi:putative Holliday junction resolvase
MSPQPGPWQRLMGLDYGDARIGIAYASTLSIGSAMVLPAGFLEQKGTKDVPAAIAEMAEEESVNGIVLGMPYLGGEESPQTKKVIAFAQRLRAVLPEKIAIYGWDESYSSTSAQFQLVEAELKHSGKKHRGRVDSAAAALILQSFVDAHKNHAGVMGGMFF